MDQSVIVTTKPQPIAAAAVVATPTVAAVVSRRHHQSGYCEICESPFTDLYDHLSSRYHFLNPSKPFRGHAVIMH